MSFIITLLTAVACAVTSATAPACSSFSLAQPVAEQVAGTQTMAAPIKTGASLDVVLSADAALVWDWDTGAMLYEKNPDKERPIASITKLLSMLVVRQQLDLNAVIKIPASVRKAQRAGADVSLPAGEHAVVSDLVAASLIPSANDAVVALATAAAGSEQDFVSLMNSYAATHGLTHTLAANGTGLSGGAQHSTARDVKTMLTAVYEDAALKDYLAAPDGSLVTQEGTQRHYESTNKLLQTYLPILAAKTGYTVEARENIAIITRGPAGQKIGAVILGSRDRFQDMKALVEWTWRNFTWP